MGEPHTRRPLISLLDDGRVQFEIEEEGLFLTFDIDIDDVPRVINRLQTIQQLSEEQTK